MSAKTWVAIGLTWESRELVTGMSDSTSSGIFMMPSMPVPAQCIHFRFLAAREYFAGLAIRSRHRRLRWR